MRFESSLMHKKDNNSENTKKYNWDKFTAQSDKRYKIARESNNISKLESHNIVDGVEKEIAFISAISKGFFGLDLAGKALDVCCGVGFMSQGLYKSRFEVTGFDLNTDAIELGANLFPACHFLHADATSPPMSVTGSQYNLILIREAHPFSRVDDFNYQV